MESLYVLIPLFPLLGFFVNIIFGRLSSIKFVNTVAISSIVASFIISLVAVYEVLSGKTIQYNLYTWIFSAVFYCNFWLSH